MSESPCSPSRDRVNSRQNTGSEPISDIDGEINYKSDEQLECSRIELQIPIYVETLMGTTFKLEVYPCDTVNSIKSQIENTEGIPASQQHLIWQNQELRNEFCIDEYGIGFGTTLRLVVSLRGGPISKSPLFSPDIERVNSGCIQSNPLTVLLFQNGDQIKMFTITTNDTIEKQGFKSSPDLVQTVQQRSESRLKEDEETKNKMKGIQEKMNEISLRRMKSKSKLSSNEINLDNNEIQKYTKLPVLEKVNYLSKVDFNKNKSLNENCVHLPPILAKSSDESLLSIGKNPSNSKPIKSNQFERQLSFIKNVLQSNDYTITPLKRPNTLSANKINDLFENKISSIREYSSVLSELNLIDKSCSKESDVKTGLRDRPSTTPFIRIISSNNIGLATKVSKSKSNFKPKSKIEVPSSHHSIESKLAESGPVNQKLPSIISRKKKSNRIRCSVCRLKLGLSNKFNCRCGQIFCARHRYSETHNCCYDFKEDGKKYLSLNNPCVSAQKLPKI